MTDRDASPSGSPPRSTSSSRWAPPAPTASTTWPTSSSPSASTTRSPRPPPTRCAITCEGPDADQVPLDRTNLAARAAIALAARHGIAPARPPPHRQGHPRRGRHGGRQRGRARARCWPATRCGATGASRDELLAICAELGSDVPFSLVGGAALGTRARRAADAAGGRRHLPLGVRGRRRRAVHPGRLRRVRPADGEGTDVPEPEASPGAARRAAHGRRRRRSPRPSANDLQPAALSLRPSLAETLDGGHRGRGAGRAGLRLGPDHRVPGQGRGGGAEVAPALLASGTCRQVRVADSPAVGARVL